MKKFAIAFLCFCISCTLFAQKDESLITKQMAAKVGYYFLKYPESLYIVDFEVPNNIKSRSEEIRILKDIFNHLKYVENFIGTSYRRHGLATAKQFFRQTFGDTPSESDLATKIACNWELKKEKEEGEAELKKEQEQWDNWTNEGAPLLPVSRLEIQPVVECQTVNAFKEALLNIPLESYYYRFIPYTDVDGFYGETISKTSTYEIQINADRTITLRSKEDYKKDIFNSMGLGVVTPGKYTFQKLNRDMEVPCITAVILEITAQEINPNHRFVFCKYDKKLGWVLNENFSTSETYKRKSSDIISLSEDEIEQLNYLLTLQKWDEKHKYFIEFTTYSLKARLIGVRNEVEIEIPNKVGFIKSHVKHW